ncbi:unnamed protein product [Rotaria socialis]|uniref:Uncharacterized protein n=1 Tax=Rotaria socialis TaxID=392032 RepID=A0A818G5K1_9BILA|nr:unnamed protein product [Rotaria socialis]CAF3443125.1 unnamed protein product [Rotaria socialis]CAF3458233.1 unnamed protein product [Rotaria socialis]CAF3483998.1 unnamed protein product [Rotaria socialis]CAF3689954.1 unnamed protein product [Rotaria socialis]
MNHGTYNSTVFSTKNYKEYLAISIEPDISLSNDQEIHLDRCLAYLYNICHIPIVLNCTLLSISSFSNATNVNRDSMRINHYLRVRQPRKFYWMRNIKQIYVTIRLPTNKNEQITANLIEFHSCRRLASAARTIIPQIKPIILIYYVEERSLKLNIRGDNCLLQLEFSSEINHNEQLQKGIYYKWSDEGHIRSTTIQFDIDYQLERNLFLI